MAIATRPELPGATGPGATGPAALMEGSANVRDRISRWMKQGLLVGVAPGHYVIAPELRKRPVSVEILANRIYGPSYVSFEYVLSRAGLIPEAVYGVTSATPKRNRELDTPLGRFSYRHLPLSIYSWGYTREELPDGAVRMPGATFRVHLRKLLGRADE